MVAVTSAQEAHDEKVLIYPAKKIGTILPKEKSKLNEMLIEGDKDT